MVFLRKSDKIVKNKGDTKMGLFDFAKNLDLGSLTDQAQELLGGNVVETLSNAVGGDLSEVTNNVAENVPADLADQAGNFVNDTRENASGLLDTASEQLPDFGEQAGGAVEGLKDLLGL